MRGFPRTLLYIYFAGTAVAFVWIFINFATWCEDDNETELLRKNLQLVQHKSDTERRQIGALKQQIQNVKVQMSKSAGQCQLAQTPVEGLPTIFVVTPTHSRLEQKADLTRLSYTLLHVPNLHWIVVEDSSLKTKLVTQFLKNSRLQYTHLNVKTPDAVKLKETDPNWLKPRGVLQRNAGLEWIRSNVRSKGVVYFADDDNTYDLQIFDEMRHTKKVTVWPVGLVGYLRYESPVVKRGKVVAWYTYWKPERAFAMDMAGFAVNVQLIHARPQAQFRMSAGRGNQESDLLTQLGIKLEDLEPRADNCTKVLVWHTRTEKSSLKNEEKVLKLYGRNSDITIEV